MAKLNTAERANQIFEAAQKIYNDIHAKSAVVNSTLKNKGMNPEKAKKLASTLAKGARPKLSKVDAALGAGILDMLSKKTASSTKTTKSSHTGMKTPKMRV